MSLKRVLNENIMVKAKNSMEDIFLIYFKVLHKLNHMFKTVGKGILHLYKYIYLNS